MSAFILNIRKSVPTLRRWLELILPWVVLAILVTYSLAYFLAAPYVGFSFNHANGQVENVYVEEQGLEIIQVGDVIKQIGEVKLSSYRADGHTLFFTGVRPGQSIDIQIVRGGHSLVVSWKIPGFNQNEFKARLFDIWILAYIFWAFGIVMQYFIRPKDIRWKLLITVNYLTGIWIVFGSLSAHHIWHSLLLFRGLTWIALPVYINLHWIFPRPLKHLKPNLWVSFYILGIVLAALQYLQIFPRISYLIPVIAMLFGSVILLVVHFIKQPDKRSEVGFLALAALIAVTPAVALGVVGLIGTIPFRGQLALLALPILPAAYIYAIYRRKLGGLEVRANVVISFLIYFALLTAFYIPVIFIITLLIRDPSLEMTVSVVITLLLSMISVLLFPRFRRWVEYRILKMPFPPSHILEIYTDRIVTSMDYHQLQQVICDEVFPSLLIRQAAIIRLDEKLSPAIVCSHGVDEKLLPKASEIQSLMDDAGKIRQSDMEMENSCACHWARLILLLHLGGKNLGLCLMGRRDPDDYYASTEIPILQALMDQTALALLNIDQSDRLLALYRSDIEWQEDNRQRLALELHDDVLGEMAILMMNQEGSEYSPQFMQAYQKATDHVRHIINGLRPSMLNYGLQLAVKELVEDATQNGDQTIFHVELTPDQIRFPAPMELHLFRIVQQACRNALDHAHPGNIWIRGRLEDNNVDLTVEDDGMGFITDGSVDIPELLANKHFGLVGMYERAALIGANMTIESNPDHGTRITVTWSRAAQ